MNTYECYSEEMCHVALWWKSWAMKQQADGRDIRMQHTAGVSLFEIRLRK